MYDLKNMAAAVPVVLAGALAHEAKNALPGVGAGVGGMVGGLFGRKGRKAGAKVGSALGGLARKLIPFQAGGKVRHPPVGYRRGGRVKRHGRRK